MSKRNFIALANAIREHNRVKRNAFGVNAGRMSFSTEEIETLADFCQSQNGAFKTASGGWITSMGIVDRQAERWGLPPILRKPL